MPLSQILFYAGLLIVLNACDGLSKNVDSTISKNITNTLNKDTETGRWFSNAQYERGKIVFRKNCIACHKHDAEGTADWKVPNENGQYPPPPLNGTAHAWHHPFAALLAVIKEGGSAYGGMMPAWKHTLSEDDMISTIAFFQHYWSDDVYERWIEIEQSAQE